MDLLLGTWAEKNVAGLSTTDMDRYEDILNLETVDIFNFIAGNAPPPAFVDTPMMARLQVGAHVFLIRGLLQQYRPAHKKLQCRPEAGFLVRGYRFPPSFRNDLVS